MNITLNGTKITQDTRNLAFEKNSGVDEIVITVDTDESWSYKLDVKYPDKYNVENDALYNIIDLNRNGITCSVILTREMLPFNGKYTMQLRGVNGDKVYHSDTFEVWVKYSIEPGSTYNPVPSEFYQVEARLDDKVDEAKKYAENAETASTRMPKISPDNTWLIWDVETGDYVDTGVKASGSGSGTSNHSLTFTGAVTGSYDGSAPLTVDIPAIDSTLTVKGKVADAKAVGDALITLSEEKVDKTAIMLATHTDGLIYLFVDGKPVGIGLDLSSGGTVTPDNPDEPEVTPSYFNVNWSNYAITCGQNTNNYNAWAPNNLQYDSKNDAFIFLQCHADKHLNHTYSAWTLTRIYPDEPWKTEDLGLPTYNGLGCLWIENGVWYVFARQSTTAYKSIDMGATWESFTTNLSAPLWGVYKCNGVYYSGDDTNTDTYYTSTDLVTWETHTFGFSDSYSALMEASFCWYKDYVWAFLRTNDATLGHPVVLKSADGLSWEFVSDSMLHTYRSMVNCYPYQDYIILADIDRDNGILYYSRFDGETVETLNEWNVGNKGDDFHCPCICSNGNNTIIITFMLHSWMNTGNFFDVAQYYCENMMLIGKTNSSELHSLTIEDIPFTNAKDFVETYCDVYPPEAVDNFTYSTNRITTTEAGYTAAVVLKEPNLFSNNGAQANEYFYRGNVVTSLYNSENLSRFGTDVNAVNTRENDCALVEIEGKRYIYKYNTDATLPSIQLRTVEKELGFKQFNDNYPQISGVLEETANLGFTKQIPVHCKTATYTNIYPHSKVAFVKAGI